MPFQSPDLDAATAAAAETNCPAPVSARGYENPESTRSLLFMKTRAAEAADQDRRAIAAWMALEEDFVDLVVAVDVDLLAAVDDHDAVLARENAVSCAGPAERAWSMCGGGGERCGGSERGGGGGGGWKETVVASLVFLSLSSPPPRLPRRRRLRSPPLGEAVESPFIGLSLFLSLLLFQSFIFPFPPGVLLHHPSRVLPRPRDDLLDPPGVALVGKCDKALARRVLVVAPRLEREPGADLPEEVAVEGDRLREGGGGWGHAACPRWREGREGESRRALLFLFRRRKRKEKSMGLSKKKQKKQKANVEATVRVAKRVFFFINVIIAFIVNNIAFASSRRTR